MAEIDPLVGFFSLNTFLLFSLSVGVISLLISVFVPRFWCRTLCPSGAFLFLCSALSPFAKKLPPKIFSKCPFSIKSKDIDCLSCDICRKDIKNTETKTNKKFSAPFLIIAISAYICIGKVYFSAVANGDDTSKIKGSSAQYSNDAPPAETRKADMKKIFDMIKINRLSSKEAAHYRKL